jgi:hypothetical protein
VLNQFGHRPPRPVGACQTRFIRRFHRFCDGGEPTVKKSRLRRQRKHTGMLAGGTTWHCPGARLCPAERDQPQQLRLAGRSGMTETVRYSDVLRRVSATQPRSVFGGSVRMHPGSRAGLGAATCLGEAMRRRKRSEDGRAFGLTVHHENPIPKFMERDKWILPVRRLLSNSREIFPAD